MAERWMKLRISNVVSSSAVFESMESKQISSDSMFVGHFYEDKLLTLRARDLIFFTSDHQTVNYHLK